MTYILAIDQGTTSSRAILYDAEMRVAGSAQQEFAQHFPQAGWVEHNPEDLWTTVIETCQAVIAKVGISASDIAAIGITNQRETTVVWDKTTGEPIYNAIVWQDRRTAPICTALQEQGYAAEVTHKTGLLLDPYFSGTKVKWILDTVEGARDRIDNLLFGTIDSFLVWRLTGGARHVTDATNAARTMMYNIRDGHWDDALCEMLDVPIGILPEVLGCDGEFGITEHFGAPIPIRGIAGDQQAATIGQACFEPGMMKSTYGTGCFALLNTGESLVESNSRLLGTIAYQLGGKVTYALEGSIFIAGAAVQWLRDGLKIIEAASDTQPLALDADAQQDVIMVPAFTGLGAPYWSAESRGAVYGLTRNSGPAEFARAALQSVGYQTADLLHAMNSDWAEAAETQVLRVDGGMCASDYTMQFLADILDARVDRPEVLESTALGVAWVAGSSVGLYPDQAGFAESWSLDRSFDPSMAPDSRNEKRARWARAIDATLQV